MTAAFVGDVDVWPEPADAFPLRMSDTDAQLHVIPSRDGWAEVPIFGERDADGRTLVVSTRFASIDQARRAARTLDLAFAKVRAIEAEPVDEPDNGHEHRFEEFRLARAIPNVSICILCGAREGGDAA